MRLLFAVFTAVLGVVSLAAIPSASAAVAESIPMDQDLRYRALLPYVQQCGVVLIQADFPLSEIESVTREIALLQEDLLLYLAVPAPHEKIDLCLFASYKSYRQFLDRLFPNAPTDRPALFIKRPSEPATLLVQRAEHFEIDLRHEMTHAILHARITNVPMWLDEGLAKYLERPRAERPYGSPYLSTVRWQTGWWLTSNLRHLESLRDVNEMGTREYRDSWAWIHFLIHYSPETHQLLASYLQYLAAVSDAAARGEPVRKTTPLSVYLDAKIESPRSAIRSHFSHWQPSTTAVTATAKWWFF